MIAFLVTDQRSHEVGELLDETGVDFDEVPVPVDFEFEEDEQRGALLRHAISCVTIVSFAWMVLYLLK